MYIFIVVNGLQWTPFNLIIYQMNCVFTQPKRRAVCYPWTTNSDAHIQQHKRQRPATTTQLWVAKWMHCIHTHINMYERDHIINVGGQECRKTKNHWTEQRTELKYVCIVVVCSGRLYNYTYYVNLKQSRSSRIWCYIDSMLKHEWMNGRTNERKYKVETTSATQKNN